jgi:regulation of enolase protein 1 (concanavalin A-like superfamily)
MEANCLLRPLAVACLVAICGAGSLGPFESNTDIGSGLQKVKVESKGSGVYRVTGGGADMWGKADAFQFAWKKVSGDMTLTADVQLIGASAQEKRKAALMIRQNLDAGSAYADIAFHGNGEVAAQWRLAAGEATGDTVLPPFLDAAVPERIRIERRGNTFTVSAGQPGGRLTAMAPFTVNLADPVYVGLAVCSHDANGLTTAEFTNVKLEPR